LAGECGVPTSKGRRQRICIAHTLYKRANVIMFNEATSAFHNDTEAMAVKVVETIRRETTILIVERLLYHAQESRSDSRTR
jgi:ATP-binding cassette subfamily B protein